LSLSHWKFDLPTTHTSDWRSYYSTRNQRDSKVATLLSVLFSGKQLENRANKRKARGTLLDWGISILDRLNYLSNPHNSNLSIAYYASFIATEINHKICLSSWENLLLTKSVPLEEGAIVISKVHISFIPVFTRIQWEYPELDAGQVRKSIDELADKVKEKFHEFGVTVTKNNVRENFEEEEDMKVLKAIRQVLFQDLNYHGNTEDYYNPKNRYFHNGYFCNG
jgi:hypothetical protein